METQWSVVNIQFLRQERDDALATLALATTERDTAVEALSLAMAELDAVRQERAAAQAALAAVTAERDAAMKVLKAVEWFGGLGDVCPLCRQRKQKGHDATDCQLAAVLEARE